MILRHKDVASAAAPAKLGRALALVHDVTEELTPRFAGQFSRTAIRRQVAEVVLDLQDSTRPGDLREVTALIATFRLTSSIQVEDEALVDQSRGSL